MDETKKIIRLVIGLMIILVALAFFMGMNLGWNNCSAACLDKIEEAKQENPFYNLTKEIEDIGTPENLGRNVLI